MNSGFYSVLYKWQLNDGNGIRKIALQKVALQKIASYENTPPPSPHEYSPLWKLRPVKITPPPEYCPRENAPWENYPTWENYPQWNPLPTYISYKWKKKQNKIIKFFVLKKAAQYSILMKITKVKWSHRKYWA